MGNRQIFFLLLCVLVIVGCSNSNSQAPNIEATVESRVQEKLAMQKTLDIKNTPVPTVHVADETIISTPVPHTTLEIVNNENHIVGPEIEIGCPKRLELSKLLRCSFKYSGNVDRVIWEAKDGIPKESNNYQFETHFSKAGVFIITLEACNRNGCTKKNHNIEITEDSSIITSLQLSKPTSMPKPKPTPTPQSKPTATPTPKPKPTSTPIPTATPTPIIIVVTATPMPIPTPTATLTPSIKSVENDKKSTTESKKPSVTSRDRIFIRPGDKMGVYPCTEDNTREFVSAIVNPESLTDMEPMGKMASSHVTPTDHLYVHWSQPAAGVTEYVVAPADGQIVEISRFPSDASPRFDSSITIPDYRMVIMHSCSFFTIFIHLGELAPDIIKQTGPISLGSQWFSTRTGPIDVKAGDPLSKINGSDGLDWSVHDADVMLSGFVVPKHYIGEPWKVHTVDPFQFYKEPLKSQLLSKVVRQAEPRAGKIDYDVEGTITGNWFLEGTDDYNGNTNEAAYWKGHIAIAYGYIDPTQIRISLGFNTGIDDDQLCNVCFSAYGVRGNSPNPKSIGIAEGLVKYELMSRQGPNHEQVGDISLGTFLVQHLGDRAIRIEFVLGVAPKEISTFSDKSLIYRR